MRRDELPVNCALAEECAAHHTAVEMMSEKIDFMHEVFNQIKGDTGYLRDMSISIGLIENYMLEMKDKLIAQATSTDRIPIESMKALMKEQVRGATLVYKVMGTMILMLVVTISYLLVGEKLGWIEKLPF